MKKPKTIAELCTQARAAKGLSLSKACALIGITKAHLHALEHGSTLNPTLVTLCGLRDVYGLTPNQLMGACKRARTSV